MKPPITMCTNGHNVCSKCRPRLFKCPICRGKLLDIRNISMEKVAESIRSKT
ncbi:E3 ubiquitin-protein ligase SIAH1 [Blattella germanica]|nr:E3 ubiquitin-protein ligase SIAH1 [Blattella germanica]